MFPLTHMMKAFVKKGQLDIIDADGKRHVFAGEPGPKVVMRLSDKALYKSLVLNPDLAAGEAYMDGTMSFEEGSTIRDLLELYSANRRALESYPMQQLRYRISMRLRRWQQDNRIGKAQSNVAHHYDIGNELYKLFLDKNLLYSCAYFESDDDTLEQAQRNKLRLLAAKMVLKPGQKVLDIGCGWGDMALYLAAMEDVEVLGVTLSREQQALASQRAQERGLSDRVKFELRDYREVTDKFDRIVSVGMFEHVGARHYGEFFTGLKSMLTDDGLAMLHSIGHMSPPGITSHWFRKYIFPGAYAPALSEVFTAVERNFLWVTDVEILRLHYAKTLKHWDDRFQSNRDKVVEMYDEKFARMWEYYLVSAEMMFRGGSQMVFQMQLSKTKETAPLTRDYMIERQKAYRKLEAKRLPPL